MAKVSFGGALALALLATASVLPFATSAAADEASEQGAASSGTPPSSPSSPPASDGGLSLSTVIVTANRREENLQVVPTAVTVVTGKTIDNSNFRQLTDLQYVIPGVQYDPTNGAAFQIRGVGSTSFDFSNEKSVSVVVDDVVMDGQRDNGLTGLEDIKSVDVLMGPQGTLFGKNATSGVINVSTNDPSLNRWSQSGSLSYGERNDYNANLLFNAPIGDTAAARVTAFTDGQDGYGRYTTLGKTLGAVEEYGYRAKLLWQPSSALQVIFSNDFAHHWDDSIRTAVGCAFIAHPTAAECASAALTALENANGVVPGPKNANDADSQEGSIRWFEFGDSLRVRYKIGEDTLTSITAWRGTRYVNDTPADLVPISEFAYIPYNNGDLHTSKFSQEFRLASPTGQFVEYLGGLFYNKLIADQTQLQWATLGAPVRPTTSTLYALTGAIGAPGDISLFAARNETAAAFGQIKFNITKAFNIAFGGRYTYDNNTQSLTYPEVSSVPYTGSVDKFIATSAQPYRPEGGVVGHNFSYKISPEYRITDDLMVYLTYSTGYKPAGVAFVGNKYDPFLDETVKSLEIGEKSEWLDHRLRLNVDVFDEHFTDFQATILTMIPGSVTLQSVIGNAGGLTSKGVETTFDLLATKSFTLSGSVTYADAYFTNYVANTTTNYTGTSLTNSPRWSGFVSADFHHDLFEKLLLDANLEYSYRSKIWTVVGQPAYSEVSGYGLANGRISLSPRDSKLQFGVYARNLFNTYFSTGWQEYGALGLLHYTSPDAYRTVGVFLKYAY